ncbi:MAG: winged helix-turn-helix domain-containing protein, partial [Casimicrobiaceae bacterium]
MTDKSSPVVGSPLLQIGDWQVDPDRNALIRSGEAVRLEPKAIEVLILLARSAGKVVGREELLATVWHGVIVGDDALTQAIIKLRKALGDSAQRPSYIETISKRGYRLIAPVAATGATTDAGGAGGPIAAPPARRRKIAVLAGAVALTLVASVVVFDSGGRLALPWPIGTASKGGTVAAAFPTVAVLPLVNLSGDPRRDYFSDGVTEDIISALGRFSGVRVMSRNAVQGFKGKSPSPQAIRDELGARYILRGSVREAGTTLRVAVELSDADHGTLLWSERYDGSDSEVFEIQERIARKIVGNLQVQLTQLEQQRTFTKPTDSLEAYDLVLRARSLLDPPERSTNRQARDLLARAEALAPAYAEVFTALGEAEMDR